MREDKVPAHAHPTALRVCTRKEPPGFWWGKLSRMAVEEVIRRQHRRLAAPLSHMVRDEPLRDVMKR